MAQPGELWKFIAECPNVDQVYLVKDRVGGRSIWLPMQRTEGRQWQLLDQLEPGYYRFRYFLVRGQTYFNGGSSDLTAFRVRGDDPRVEVEPLKPDGLASSA